MGKQKTACVSTLKTIFFLCQTFKSTESLILQIKSRNSILLALGESAHKSTQPSKIRDRSHECVFCFSGVFPPLSVCVWAMNTQHQGKYFYLHFNMSNSKQLGVHNCSGPVILSATEGRERECVRGMRDFVKRDRASEHVLEKESDRA